jgi:hypothetical protein
MTRKLKNGTKVEELDTPVLLEVYTKCPSKWKLVDMETGEEYIGQDPEADKVQPQYWKRVN